MYNELLRYQFVKERFCMDEFASWKKCHSQCLEINNILKHI